MVRKGHRGCDKGAALGVVACRGGSGLQGGLGWWTQEVPCQHCERHPAAAAAAAGLRFRGGAAAATGLERCAAAAAAAATGLERCAAAAAAAAGRYRRTAAVVTAGGSGSCGVRACRCEAPQSWAVVVRQQC